ncbi:MAG: glycosyltransferase family 2 protein [Lachnospiraceae bacterium]|jgi:glycosyltransferase involved in cell wall biosynthesis|nr:glycosyltransferase family 2 protein [Lachnospiraceae bacterium]
MKPLPKVSVIIPVYNTEKYLRECLNSVVDQTLRDIEIICIDDGSTDESPRILEMYSEQDKRICLIRQPNSGSGTARNKGILTAKGEYIAFMDADDLYPERTTLERLYQTATENDVNICGGSLYRLQNGVLIKRFSDLYSGYIFREEGEILYKDYQFEYGYYRFIFKRTFLLDHHILFPDYLRFQDPPFFVRAMIAAQRFYAIPDVTYLYRQHDSHFTANEKKVTDAILGITEVIQLAKENDLQKLYETMVNRCCGDYWFPMLTTAERFENEDAHKALKKLNESIDLNRFYGIDSEIYKLHLIVRQTDSDKVRLSASYRTGHVVTWIPRLMVSAYCAFRNNILRKHHGKKQGGK